MSQDYFLLDDAMYHKSMIRMVEIDGGPDEGYEQPAKEEV